MQQMYDETTTRSVQRRNDSKVDVADESVIPLTAFTAILQEICQGSEVTEDALLYADDFDLETNVIINVTQLY